MRSLSAIGVDGVSEILALCETASESWVSAGRVSSSPSSVGAAWGNEFRKTSIVVGAEFVMSVLLGIGEDELVTLGDVDGALEISTSLVLSCCCCCCEDGGSHAGDES